MPSPGTVKQPSTTASRKLQSFARACGQHVLAHILAMHMGDAGAVFLRQRDRIGAAEGGMAGVQQQLHRMAGRFHEGVDVLAALHHRAHVVMIGEGDAFLGHRLGDLGHALAELAPVGRPSASAAWTAACCGRRGSRSRSRRRSGCWSRAPSGGRDARADASSPPWRRAAAARGIPARHQVEPGLAQHRLQGLGLARELVAELDALVAGLLGFLEAGLERGLAAQLAQIVIRPANRIDAETDTHGSLISNALQCG